MNKLPVIAGFGGISAAGRSSGHQGFRRLVIDALSDTEANQTLSGLRQLMRSDDDVRGQWRQYVIDHTLIRRIENELHFNPDAVPWNRRVVWEGGPEPLKPVRIRKSQLPSVIPEEWDVIAEYDQAVDVQLPSSMDVLLPDVRSSEVRAAGQLPTGFDPAALYPARSHPRGLQMTIYGATDALGSSGISWDVVRNTVSPDQISVYAGSGMSQLDVNGNGGMMSARMNGKRVSSKNCPFGFAEMPADFINAYVLGSVGNTGTSMGACASFLYNLRSAVNDIQSGRARVALVGNAEAPITPEVIEGYAAMGALATDTGLRNLDGLAEDVEPDHRRACRPFVNNCGFTIAESAQFVLLMDDALALELGAMVFGAVADVFVNADGFKKSISAPGVGNYLTMARAVALGRTMLGNESVRYRSFVHAHGTGTPQNRVTESHILDETAKLFGIESWPVAAIKSYLGHSIGCAGGDQLVMTLGSWAHGLIPGITTMDAPAEDVHREHLQLQRQHIAFGVGEMDLAFINAKGFGGNNASCAVLAPHVAENMLKRRHGADAFTQWQRRNEHTREQAADFDARSLRGEVEPIYHFDHGVLAGEDIGLGLRQIQVPGFAQPVSLDLASPYPDMTED